MKFLNTLIFSFLLMPIFFSAMEPNEQLQKIAHEKLRKESQLNKRALNLINGLVVAGSLYDCFFGNTSLSCAFIEGGLGILISNSIARYEMVSSAERWREKFYSILDAPDIQAINALSENYSQTISIEIAGICSFLAALLTDC